MDLIALDALATARAVQRWRLKGEALVPTSLAHVLILLINGRQTRLPCIRNIRHPKGHL